MNKRAFFVLTFLAFLVVGALVFFFYYQASDTVKGKVVTFVGEKQLSLMRSQLVTSDDLFFLDQGVRLASYKTVFDLAAKGGFKNPSECGSFDGYNLWSSKDRRCFPSTKQLGDNFVEMFRFNFNSFRGALQDRGLLVSYSYFYDNGEIIGVSDSKWVYKDKYFIHKVNPSFREKIDFNLDYYLYLQEFVVSLDSCADLKSGTVEQCVLARMTQAMKKHPELNIMPDACTPKKEGFLFVSEAPLTVKSIEIKDNKIKFCTIVDKKFPYIKEGKSMLKNPEILFAVTLKDK